MDATINAALLFDAVSDDFTSAMGTGWSKSMNGALKAVEHVPLASRRDLKTFVVIVSADFAFSHRCNFLSSWNRNMSARACASHVNKERNSGFQPDASDSPRHESVGEA